MRVDVFYGRYTRNQLRPDPSGLKEILGALKPILNNTDSRVSAAVSGAQAIAGSPYKVRPCQNTALAGQWAWCN